MIPLRSFSLCASRWMSWAATTAAGSSSKAPSRRWSRFKNHRTLPGRQRATKSKPARTNTGFKDPRVQIVHASEFLTMEDKPVEGLRRKKDCSILRAVDLLREGKADALISPGQHRRLGGGLDHPARGRSPASTAPESPPSFPAQENEFVLLGLRGQRRMPPDASAPLCGDGQCLFA